MTETAGYWRYTDNNRHSLPELHITEMKQLNATLPCAIWQNKLNRRIFTDFLHNNAERPWQVNQVHPRSVPRLLPYTRNIVNNTNVNTLRAGTLWNAQIVYKVCTASITNFRATVTNVHRIISSEAGMRHSESDGIWHFFQNLKSVGYLKSDRVGFAIRKLLPK